MQAIPQREYYDPHAPRDLSPIKIGRFIVLRTRAPGAPYTRYHITLRGRTIGHQISYPSLADCERYETQNMIRVITSAQPKKRGVRGWRLSQNSEAGGRARRAA